MIKARDSKQAPDYPRIPHLQGIGSRMTADDIETAFPETAVYASEKVDAANCGIAWTAEGPLVRNRSKILNKAFNSRKDTPAKAQFRPIWGWAYAHADGFKEIEKRFGSPVTVYGEWMWAEHSLHYDKLPDWFLAYDVWSTDAQRFVVPSLAQALFAGTGIHFIPQTSMILTVESAKNFLDLPSAYRTGIREGAVFKSADETGEWVAHVCKAVRADFVRMDDDWNKRELKKNAVTKP